MEMSGQKVTEGMRSARDFARLKAINDVPGVVSSRREPLAPPAWAAHDANIPRFDDALVVMSHDDSVVESRVYATCGKYGH
jgi:hypothetical protein